MRVNMSTLLAAMLLATESPAQNLIRNSSFEVGLDGFGFRRAAQPDEDGKAPYAMPTLDEAVKSHGTRSLRLDNPNRDAVRIHCAEVRIEAGQSHSFSFWAKASNDRTKIATEDSLLSR